MEPALQLLEHVAQQFKQNIATGLTQEQLLEDDEALYISLVDRTDRHLVASDIIFSRLFFLTVKGCRLDDAQLARLLQLLEVAVNLRIEQSAEWLSLIDLSVWEKIYIAITMRKTKWSVDNMVKLFQIIGTHHYQLFNKNNKQKIFPQAITLIIEEWSRAEIGEFFEKISNVTYASLLQHDITEIIQLLHEKK